MSYNSKIKINNTGNLLRREPDCGMDCQNGCGRACAESCLGTCTGTCDGQVTNRRVVAEVTLGLNNKNV